MGINGAFLTGDAFNLFVFFEVLLIASYGLMIHGGGANRLRAGIQYVAFNLVGSTLFLFALATVYSVAGTLNMADLAVKVAALPAGDAALVRVGAVMLLMVFAIKGALVPLQFWLPATYGFAPGPVAALFAVMTKVGAYAVIRVFTLIFPPDTAATGMLFGDILLPAALLTLALGALGVMGASGLARLAAFAGIGSMGTLFIAVAQFTPEAMAAGLYYLVHSTLVLAVLFLIVDMVQDRRGSDSTAEAMPPMDATRGPDMAMIWAIILITSLITMMGFARAGSTVFWKAHALSTTQQVPEHPTEPLAHTMIFALMAALVALTVFAGPVTAWMGDTAAGLFERTAYIQAVLPDGARLTESAPAQATPSDATVKE